LNVTILKVIGKMEEKKVRRHITIPYDVDKEMKNSGIDISAWVTDKWVDSNYSIETLKKEITMLKDSINYKEEKYNKNKIINDNLYVLSSKQELNFFSNFDKIIKKHNDSPAMVDQICSEQTKLYYHYFKVRISRNMIMNKYKAYLKKIGEENE